MGQWPTTVLAIYRRLIQAVYFRDGITVPSLVQQFSHFSVITKLKNMTHMVQNAVYVWN